MFPLILALGIAYFLSVLFFYSTMAKAPIAIEDERGLRRLYVRRS